MAGGADLLEDLEAALQLAPVEGAEDAFVLPVLIGDVRRVAGGMGGLAAREGQRADHQPGQQRAPHHDCSPEAGAAAAPPAAAAPAAAASPAPSPSFSTAWWMLSGTLVGRSNLPISGTTMRKCAK